MIKVKELVIMVSEGENLSLSELKLYPNRVFYILVKEDEVIGFCQGYESGRNILQILPTIKEQEANIYVSDADGNILDKWAPNTPKERIASANWKE